MPWPTQGKYLGKPQPRAEGPAKASGRAKFTTDVVVPGMLYGAILRSKWPAAHIHSIDLSKALAAPGIKAGLPMRSDEFDVFYYGAELAAIAGTSRQAVLDALALIKVDAEPRPFVVNETDAVKPDATSVNAGKPNLGYGKVNERGDVDAAFAAAAAVIEGNYGTQIEFHQPLEPHGHVVQWDGDSMTAWASSQGVHGARDVFVRSLGVKPEQVRVVCEHMGGGFGSKFSPNAEGILCARLAKLAGAPVRLILSRFEEALAVGNRPSSFQRIKLGADASGKLTAFELESYGTPGFNSGILPFANA
jgi:xanthine dehydrogenase YagR molybdenum-binding subunit